MARTGRPTKYDPRLNTRAKEYIKDCKKKVTFPTIEQLSTVLGVGTRTLYEWERLYDDFQQTMDILRDTQRHLLIANGLTGKYSTRFAIFLLKASHKLRENEPLVENNQNYMNISPDILADALKLMRSKA